MRSGIPVGSAIRQVVEETKRLRIMTRRILMKRE
jgi:hypothetical protein